MIGKILEWLSRHATPVLAGSVLLGLAVPPLADAFSPLLNTFLVLNLTVAMLRLDFGAVLAYARRPVLILAVVVFAMILTPLGMVAAVTVIAPFDELAQALVLLALTPTVISAVAYCMILGLDTALAVTVMVVSYAIVPFTMPTLALWLMGLDLNIDAGTMMLRLGAVVGIATLLGAVCRKWVFSPAFLRDNAKQVEGAAVLTIAVLGVAIMSGVTEFSMQRPTASVSMIVALFIVNICLQLAGIAAFWKLGRREAFTIGLVTAYTNLILVLAALGDSASIELRVFCGLGQLPMFLLPIVMLPAYRRLLGNTRAPGR